MKRFPNYSNVFQQSHTAVYCVKKEPVVVANVAMNVSSMLSNGSDQHPKEEADTRRLSHQYPTRHAASTQDQSGFAKPYSPAVQQAFKATSNTGAGAGYGRVSPAKKNQKHVLFQLIDQADPRIQARLPMRVMISTHDTTDSIITTVKNFYGLYEYGVSFENKDGVGIIAAYDNFDNDMIVYVRTVAQPLIRASEQIRDSASPNRPSLGAPIDLRPSQHNQTHSPSKAGIRSVGSRSMSPHSENGQRSASAAPGVKARPHKSKSRDNSAYGENDGYSSGENGGGSVASSRRSRQELVNAEISVDNIVEGGRRKRAFESSVSISMSKVTSQVLTTSGTATIRSTASADEHVDLVNLTAASRWASKCHLAVSLYEPADVLVHSAIAFAAELR